ncbi:MAG: type-F conjugative transfer system pilin assembly protein TrbC [Thermodesulfobacteriota bacterium]
MLRVLKRITVMAGAMILLALYLAAGHAFAGGKSVNDLKMNDIAGVLQEAQEKAKELQLSEQYPADDCGCQDAAGKLMDKFNAPDHQAKMRDEQQRLRETIFKDILTEFMPQGEQHSPPDTASNSAQLYLFVSSSVPLTTLRNYAAMIDHARSGQVTMVLRGFVGGMKEIRPTMEFIGEILKKDPACDFMEEKYPARRHKCDSYQVNIQVDPLLFQRFAIDEVPALAYLPVSESDTEGKEAEPLIVNGDAGLDYLLERINREAKRADLNRLIAALRGRTGNGN